MTTDQAAPDGPLNAADFHASGYDAVLQTDSDFGVHAESGAFNLAADSAIAAGRPRAGAVLRLLAGATSMMLTPDSKTRLFTPTFETRDARSPLPEDFTAHEIALFAEVAGSVAHAQLRARLADLVWLRIPSLGQGGSAKLAIDAYLEASRDTDTWFAGGRDGWARALSLALSIRDLARVATIEAALVDTVLNGPDEGYVPLQAARLLLDNKRGKERRADIAARLEELAKAHEASGRHQQAIAYFEIAEPFYARAADQAKAIEMAVAAATNWEAQGDRRGAGLAALHSYENAVKALRPLPRAGRAQHGVDAKVEQLHAKVRTAGQVALSQMQRIQSDPIDITELVEQATAAVTGKDPLNALGVFASIHRDLRVASIRAGAEKSLQGSLFRLIAGSTILSAEGNTIARQPAAGGGADSAEAALWAQMVNEYTDLIGLIVQATIEPALDAMRLEHAFTLWDYEDLCRHSPFVPHDRVDLVAQGLYAGYCGDLVQAVHILAPQLEHIVRHQLQNQGAITTTTSAEGIVMESGMSTIVKMPQMATVFGEDLTFELRALFCDQQGPNLRNNVAHGLASRAMCESPPAIYAWWLVFSLMFGTFWEARYRDAQAEAAGTQVSDNAKGGAPVA